MKDKIITIIKSYSTEEEGRSGIYEHILEDFYEDMAMEIAALNKVASSSRIISESDKPKGLDLEKLELKLDKALQRDYSDSEANDVCIICGEETITLCRTHAKQVLNLQDLFDDTDER